MNDAALIAMRKVAETLASGTWCTDHGPTPEGVCSPCADRYTAAAEADAKFQAEFDRAREEEAEIRRLNRPYAEAARETAVEKVERERSNDLLTAHFFGGAR